MIFCHILINYFASTFVWNFKFDGFLGSMSKFSCFTILDVTLYNVILKFVAGKTFGCKHQTIDSKPLSQVVGVDHRIQTLYYI